MWAQVRGIGTVVFEHRDPDGYHVEFCSPDGGTIALVVLTEQQIKLLPTVELTHSHPTAR
ncbi:MAG: DUF4926 domain-containing protein [Candidatus Omnitrophica bacterium]|nr:DUF4926 domain-containing protein [Candidatus Omnitrophota bacterium]